MKLGDVCEIVSSGTPKRSVRDYWEDGDIPWVKISDMGQRYVNKTEEFITQEGLLNSSAKLFEPGTLLFSIFTSIGAVGILDIPAATNQAIAGIKTTSPSINYDYLHHWLQSQEAASKSAGHGVAQNNINLTILRNMKVPLPHIKTQEVIASRFENVEEKIGPTKHQLSKLNDLVKSLFIWDSTNHLPYNFLVNAAQFKNMRIINPIRKQIAAATTALSMTFNTFWYGRFPTSTALWSSSNFFPSVNATISL